jgi:hypothetical protein
MNTISASMAAEALMCPGWLCLCSVCAFNNKRRYLYSVLCSYTRRDIGYRYPITNNQGRDRASLLGARGEGGRRGAFCGSAKC